MSKYISEGEDHIRAANKNLKTSLFKWKPDHDMAGYEFDKAGVCFKNARDFHRSLDCYIRAAEAYLECKNHFHAAKSYECGALISRDMKNFTQAADMMEKASNLYQTAGSGDVACQCLDKGAKFLETAGVFDRAISFYQKASGICEIEDRTRNSADYLGRAAKLYCRTGSLDKASSTLEKQLSILEQMDAYDAIGQVVCALVLIALNQDDLIAATKVYGRTQGYDAKYVHSEFNTNVALLLNGLEAGDGDKCRHALTHGPFRHLDNDYAKLVRPLLASQKQAATSGEGDTATDSPGAADADEDDMSYLR